MKYIDAEKLIEKFEKMIDNIPASVDSGAGYVIDEVYKIIDSLQQEHPEPSCKTCGFYENNCPFIRDTFKPYPNKVCKDYTYSVMREHEQSEVDLEKAAEEYEKKHTYQRYDGSGLTPEYDAMLTEAFNAEAERQKEQRMRDTVEAEIQMQWDSFYHNLAEYGDEQEEVVWLNWNSFEDVCRDLYELGLNAIKENEK